jgi:hypothetical protein
MLRESAGEAHRFVILFPNIGLKIKTRLEIQPFEKIRGEGRGSHVREYLEEEMGEGWWHRSWLEADRWGERGGGHQRGEGHHR